MKWITASALLILLAGCAGETTSPPKESKTTTTEGEAPAGGAPKVGDRFTGYEVPMLSGGSWAPGRGDAKATLVNVWATWCVPCREETPELVKLAKTYEAAGLEVVGISIDAPNHRAEIEEFIREYSVPYGMAHDEEQRIAGLFEVSIIPFSFLLDREGKVIWMHAGTLTAEDAPLLEAIRKTTAG